MPIPTELVGSHSKEVPYEKLLSRMFDVDAGYFLIQCAKHGSPDFARDVAMQKIEARLERARMASEELGVYVGPKRSVRTWRGSKPASSASSTAASTKAFEPQTNAIPWSIPAEATSSASMRPVWPAQPGGGSRV
jgi:hypothetical protein